MSRINQVNELLKNELANLIVQEIPMHNVLITISYVDCSTDLKNAKIGISVVSILKPSTSIFFPKNTKDTSGTSEERRLSRLTTFLILSFIIGCSFG